MLLSCHARTYVFKIRVTVGCASPCMLQYAVQHKIQHAYRTLIWPCCSQAGLDIGASMDGVSEEIESDDADDWGAVAAAACNSSSCEGRHSDSISTTSSDSSKTASTPSCLIGSLPVETESHAEDHWAAVTAAARKPNSCKGRTSDSMSVTSSDKSETASIASFPNAALDSALALYAEMVPNKQAADTVDGNLLHVALRPPQLS